MIRSRVPARLVVGAATLALMGSLTAPALAQPSNDGRVIGHFMKSNGQPVAGADVLVHTTTGALRGRATTGADGSYVAELGPAFDNTVKVQFSTDLVHRQYAHQKNTFQEADTFTVTPGTDTVVDEIRFPTGSIVFTASDKVTGAPVASFCASAFGPFAGFSACTDTGSLTANDLRVGDYPVVISSNQDYLNGSGSATVVADGTTPVHVELEPVARIMTTVLDAATRAPVADACLHAVTGIGGFGHRDFFCSGPDGRVTIDRLHAGSYRLYASTQDGVHGDQWVGTRGGTGSRYLATPAEASAGQTVTGPTVLLDGAGSITGTVVDQATGAPVDGVCAYSHASDNTGGPDPAPHCTGPDGRYTIDGLGPYPWPVQFIDTSGAHAWQWSGDRPTQLTARPVRVRVGQTTTEDAHLGPAATVSGRVMNSNSQPGSAFIWAYNAIIGDPVANVASLDENGNFQLRGIAGPQLIKIEYRDITVGGPTGRYLDASGFASADPVLVRRGAAVTGANFSVSAG